MSPRARAADPTEPASPITRDDLEAKFRELKGGVDDTAKAASGAIVAAGAVAVVGLVAVAFLLGSRRGKKRTTVVEVRRI